MSTIGHELLLIVGMSLAVYLPKVGPLIAMPESLTERLRPWLRYVAPAVLGALVGPAIVAPAGAVVRPGWDQVPFAVALIAALVTRSMVPSLAAGLLTLGAVTLLSHA